MAPDAESGGVTTRQYDMRRQMLVRQRQHCWGTQGVLVAEYVSLEPSGIGECH